MGNKSDDPARRRVDTQDAMRFGESVGVRVFETSAKENINVEEVTSILFYIKLTQGFTWYHLIHAVCLTSCWPVMLLMSFSKMWLFLLLILLRLFFIWPLFYLERHEEQFLIHNDGTIPYNYNILIKLKLSYSDRLFCAVDTQKEVSLSKRQIFMSQIWKID